MMNKPNKPGDPASLSLEPSRGAGGADFSKVRSGASGSAQGESTADFSKVRSAVSSTESSTSSSGARSHTVQKGDTLSHLAKQYYGKASEWTRIFEANRNLLDDPDRIFPGQVLRIPDSGS
jgi:nucleoid-associated protein YgaU